MQGKVEISATLLNFPGKKKPLGGRGCTELILSSFKGNEDPKGYFTLGLATPVPIFK